MIDNQYNNFAQNNTTAYFSNTVPVEVTMMNNNGTCYNQGGIITNQGGFNPATGVITGEQYNPYIQFTNYQNGGYYNNFLYNNMNMYGNNPYCYLENLYDIYNRENNTYEDDNNNESIRYFINSIAPEEDNKSIKIVPIYDVYGNIVEYEYVDCDLYNLRQKSIKSFNASIIKAFYTFKNIPFTDKDINDRMEEIMPENSTSNFQEFSKNSEDQLIEEGQQLNKLFEFQESYNQYFNNVIKPRAFQQIKDSHDIMLGISPGESYNLTHFLNNGHRLLENIERRRMKLKQRNGLNKYDSDAFRRQLEQSSKIPIPSNDKDDEFISVEEQYNHIYEENKKKISSEVEFYKNYRSFIDKMKQENDAKKSQSW